VTPVTDDVDGFNDVGMFESGADAELGGDLLLILLHGLAGLFEPKLFDGKDGAIVFSLDQADSATGAGSEGLPPFAILLGKVCLCGLGE